MPKLEKTVAELERRLRLANSTLNSIPKLNENTKSLNSKRKEKTPIDEESRGLMEEEEKQNLIAEMDFEVFNQ